MAEGSGPLAGLRVLDLTRVLVGPYAPMLLGELGAEVIKVERPGEGDESRTIPPLEHGESHYFLSVNKCKKGIAVDMKRPEGREIVIELARRADVLVENFRPGVVDRLGLGWNALSALNPRLVYCSISAFGATGPYAQRSAFDIAVQAMSGAMSVTGEPEGPPTRMGLPMADLAGGLFAVIGVQAALLERDRSGRGQFVDLSMLDAMVSLLMYNAGRVFMTGEDPEKTGTGHASVVPYGAFECADGWIVLANFGDAFWTKICAALGFPEMAHDARYDTNAKRIERRAEVEAMVTAAFRRKDVGEWDRILEEADVPHAPILSVSEVLDHPQVRARGMVVEVEHATLGRWRALGPAIRFPAGAEDGGQRAAPVLGQHTDEILRDLLGYPPELIRRLSADAVIQTWPEQPPDKATAPSRRA